MMVGVNGSGKTTTAGKLAEQWRQDGLKVTMAAADTFARRRWNNSKSGVSGWAQP